MTLYVSGISTLGPGLPGWAGSRAVLAGEPSLRVMAGKEMHELRPDLEWDKGRAVLHLNAVEGLPEAHTLQDRQVPYSVTFFLREKVRAHAPALLTATTST